MITASETEPRRYGKQIVLGGILDHLVARLGADQVHLIHLGGADDYPPVSYQRHTIAKPGPVGQVASVVRHVALASVAGGALSLQEAVLRSATIADELRDQINLIDADLEIWDTVRLGQYAPVIERRPGIRRVLYADDLFSLRYRSMLAEADAGNAGGEFQKLLPGPARRLLSWGPAQRTLLRAEAHLVERSETRQPAWFDRTLLVSDVESDTLRSRLAGSDPIPAVDTLPPLLQATEASVVREGVDTPEFTFLGGFNYAPNRAGLEWFLRECREAVQQLIPEAVFNVVGAGTEHGLPEAEPWGGAVRFLGWVDDLDQVLNRSMALISPLRSGSGIKIKALEALARGLPVIATPAGVQGIAGPPPGQQDSGGFGYLVGNTPDELARAMVALTNPERRREVSAAALRTWRQHYARDVVQRRYDELFSL